MKFFKVVKDTEHLKRVKIALSKCFISFLTFTLYVAHRTVCVLFRLPVNYLAISLSAV